MYIENISKSGWPESAMVFLQLAIMIPLACGAVQAYSSGPPPRYSGAPGDDAASCASCHRGLSVNGGQGSVKILLPNGNSYTPGMTQHITVQVSDPQQRRWGFQLSARLTSDLTNGQAGDFKPTDGFTQVICDSGTPKPCPNNASVQFIEHTVSGTRSGTPGGATFEFDWTPPAANLGNIVLYAAGNAANGNGVDTGDHIYAASLEITPTALNTPPSSLPAISVAKRHNQTHLILLRAITWVLCWTRMVILSESPGCGDCNSGMAAVEAMQTRFTSPLALRMGAW